MTFRFISCVLVIFLIVCIVEARANAEVKASSRKVSVGNPQHIEKRNKPNVELKNTANKPKRPDPKGKGKRSTRKDNITLHNGKQNETLASADEHNHTISNCLAPEPAIKAPEPTIVKIVDAEDNLNSSEEISAALKHSGEVDEPPNKKPENRLNNEDEAVHAAISAIENPRYDPHRAYRAMNNRGGDEAQTSCATCGHQKADARKLLSNNESVLAADELQNNQNITNQPNLSPSLSPSMSLSHSGEEGEEATVDANTQCRIWDDLPTVLKARLIQNKLSKLARHHQRKTKRLVDSVRQRERELLQKRDAMLAQVPGFWYTALKALPNYPIYSIPYEQQQSSVNTFEAPEDRRNGVRLWRVMGVDDQKIMKYHLVGIHCSRFYPSQALPLREKEIAQQERVNIEGSLGGASSDELLDALRHLSPNEEHFNISFYFGNNWRRFRSHANSEESILGEEDLSSEIPPHQGDKLLMTNVPVSDDPNTAFPFSNEDEDNLPHFYPFTQKTLTKFIGVSSALRSSRLYGDAATQHEEHRNVMENDSTYQAIAQAELDVFDREEHEREKVAEGRAVEEGMAVIDALIEEEERQEKRELEELEASLQRDVDEQDGDNGALKRKNEKPSPHQKPKKAKMSRKERLAEYLVTKRAERAAARQMRRITKTKEVQLKREANRQSRLTELQQSWAARALDNTRHEYGVGTTVDWGSSFVGIERDDVIPFLTGMNWHIEGYPKGNSVPIISARRRLLSHTLPVAGSFFSFFQPPENYKHYSEVDRATIKLRLYGLISDVCGPLSARPIDIYDEFFIEEAFRAQRDAEERREAEALAEQALERLRQEADAIQILAERTDL